MKGRKQRNTGGVNQADEDLATKPEKRVNSKINAEAEEKKSGGRAKKKAGGEACEKKHVGAVPGTGPKPRADRKPRKNGGRTGSDSQPFTSARHGTAPPGRKLEMN